MRTTGNFIKYLVNRVISNDFQFFLPEFQLFGDGLEAGTADETAFADAFDRVEEGLRTTSP